MLKQRLFILWASVIVLAGFGQLSAQVTTATISGTVTDVSGAVVSNAAIQVKNADTGIVQEVSTDEQGRYNVPSLPVGNYDVQVDGDLAERRNKKCQF